MGDAIEVLSAEALERLSAEHRAGELETEDVWDHASVLRKAGLWRG